MQCEICNSNKIKRYNKYSFRNENSTFNNVLMDKYLYKCLTHLTIQANHSSINIFQLNNYYQNNYSKRAKKLYPHQKD